MEERATTNRLIRNIPVDVIEKLKVQAKDNHRSMNNEIVAILEKEVK